MNLPQLPVISDTLLYLSCTIAILSVLVPVIVAVFVWRQLKTTFMPFLIGIVSYVFSQYLILTPLLSLLSAIPFIGEFIVNHNVLYAIIYSLLTGISCCAGLYIGCKYMMKDRTYWADGVMMGVGYWGADAVSVLGLTYFQYFMAGVGINSGLVKDFEESLYMQYYEMATAMTTLSDLDVIFNCIAEIAIGFFFTMLALIMLHGVSRNHSSASRTIVIMSAFVTFLLSIFGLYLPVVWYMVLTVPIAILSLRFITDAREKHFMERPMPRI